MRYRHRVWESARCDFWTWSALGLAIAAGVSLRIWRLSDQLPWTDEVHAIRVAQAKDAAFIFTHHAWSDYSIPIALWDRLLIQTIGLDEWGLRVVALLPGLLLIPLLSAAAWRAFGSLEAIALAWILALSPILIRFSRFGRPYMAVVFLTALTVMAWFAWRRRGDWGWGLLASVAGATAIFFNLTAVAPLLAVFGWGLADALLARRRQDLRRATARRWVAVSLPGALLCAILLLPGAESLVTSIRSKAGGSTPAWATLVDASYYVYGVNSPIVLLAVIATTVVGAVVALRRHAELGVALLLLLVSSAAAVQVLELTFSDFWFVYARYVIVALPGLLLFLAVGLAYYARSAARLLRGSPRLASGVGSLILACGIAVIVADGPLRKIYWVPNAFTMDLTDYVGDTSAVSAPDFYHELAANRPAELIVAEAPYSIGFPIYARYQSLHRQRVRGVSEFIVFASPGIRFRSVRRPDPAQSPSWADVLILHRNLFRETVEFSGVPWFWGSDRPILTEQLLVDAARRIERIWSRDSRLERIYEDEWLLVYAPRDLTSSERK